MMHLQAGPGELRQRARDTEPPSGKALSWNSRCEADAPDSESGRTGEKEQGDREYACRLGLAWRKGEHLGRKRRASKSFSMCRKLLEDRATRPGCHHKHPGKPGPRCCGRDSLSACPPILGSTSRLAESRASALGPEPASQVPCLLCCSRAPAPAAWAPHLC